MKYRCSGKLLAVWLAAVMWMSGLPVYGSESAQPLEVSEEVEESLEVETDVLPDNEVLFEQYAEALFSDEFLLAEASSGESALNEREQAILAALKKAVYAIASGESTDTAILIDDSAVDLSWSYAELGLDISADWETEIAPVVKEKFAEEVDSDLILRQLLFECPYAMYWFDKSEAVGIGYDVALSIFYGSNEKSSLKICDLTYKFTVDQAYRGTNIYETDPDKTQAAAKSAEMAKDIVVTAASCSDYEKLCYYREQICDLVSYNTEAVDESYDTSVNGIDPWQLIYVFDGDPSTNVVCEGYAKAFQYLCDLTEFESGKVKCITVSGTMAGATGAGGHMWNVVSMQDGLNYLVDVTNSDAGTIGADGRLFLAGTTGSVEEGYTFSFNASNVVSYSYDSDTRQVYKDSRLLLAEASFDPEAEILCRHENTSLINAKESSCRETGYSGDVFCEDCETVVETGHVLELKDHTPVVDEAVAATCEKTGLTEGSHCAVCKEILTEQAVLPATGHTQSDPVKEHEVAAGYKAEGSYDLVTYCENCHTELARETVTLPKLQAKSQTIRVGTSAYSFTYDAKKAQSAAFLVSGAKGSLSYTSGNKKYVYVSDGRLYVAKGTPAGSYTLRVQAGATASGEYAASNIVTVSVKVKKAANTLQVTPAGKTYKLSAVKRAAKTFTIRTSKAAGKVTFTSASKKLKVTSKGKVTVKKKTPKGTYKITVKAAGNKNYLSGKKIVKVIVK